jgi:diguanylate cyclase (GGDEF)-like protein
VPWGNPDVKRSAVHAYVAAVAALGLVAFLFPLFGADTGPSRFATPEFALLAAYVVIGEVYPLRVMRGGREAVLTVSTTFAFAILLWLGVAEAMVALVLASVCGDVLRRAPWMKVLFNAGQFAVCIALAGTVLENLRAGTTATGPVPITETGLVATAAAGGVFFLSNFLLSGIVLALATNTPVLRLLGRDLLPQSLWTGVLLSLAPIVVAAAEASLALLPLFIVPMAAVYRSTEVLLQREHEALHDPLTGLPNRTLFGDRVRQAILSARRSGDQAAIMVLDFDGFKDVNDTLGHRAGDEVLQLVSGRLTGVLRAADTVARLGGDEFGVVVWPVDGESGATQVARKIRTAVHEPLRFGEVVMTLEVSIGLALTPTHGTDPDSLVSYADAGMFEAKRLRSGWEFHDPLRFMQTANRMTRLARLRHAVRNDQLELYYQPKFSVGTGQVDGVEALVRWNDPEEGLVLPDRFIPLAEETGLIRDVTRFVLSAAIEEAARLQRDGLPQRVAVNVSVRDLQDPALPDEVVALLARAGIDPHWLELEITERTLMSNPSQAVAVIGRLHDVGVTVTIDDFGTGNTSLALLSRLPVDCLKLDRSLVVAMAEERADALIVETTIDLGHNLGMTVVAEGVETLEVWQRLGQLGCDSAQGFFCGPPVRAVDLRRQLLERGVQRRG